MPESVTDRPTSATEKIFLLTKSANYFYDAEAVKEPSTGQNGQAANFARDTKDHKIPGQNEKQHRKDRTPTEDNGKRNLRNYWILGPSPFPGEYCKACKNYFPQGWRRMKRRLEGEDGEGKAICPKCGSWEDWVGHFATFGQELVETCIKAGTSEKGVCPKCLAQWVRVVEKKGLTAHDGKTESAYEKGTTANRLALLRQAARERGEEYRNETTTLGWQPSCKCGDNVPVPATVLDIFGGAGTTGLVAAKMGRNSILIELKPEYCDMARKRIKADMGMLAEVTVYE